jgi:TRAP-type C4-dicarboxylate transport system permease large subunit
MSNKAIDANLNLVEKNTQRVFSSIILALLFVTIVAGTSENMHGQMLKMGAYFWPDYFVLRGEEPVVNCDINFDLEQRLDELETEHADENADFDLFETEFDRVAARNSLLSQIQLCESQHEAAAIYKQQFTIWVQMFRSIEHSLASVSLLAIEHQRLTLILLLAFAALVTTWKKCHIAFRSIHSSLDHKVSNIGQFIANGSLGLSTVLFIKGSYESGTVVDKPELLIILSSAAFMLCLINLYQLKNPGQVLENEGSIWKALLSIPIHSIMLLAACLQFFIAEGHFPGIAIYFTQIFQLTNLHLAIGLYILVGMLLKETLVGAKLFDILKPWHLPPEFLAFIAIAMLAFPTAYTGASGIIIIAMGAVVYQEMRRVGTRRQLSLAVTAMTGSGVVLRPCLLVVGIAILNKEVVTDELFHWGFKVFLLSMVVFAVFAMITRKDPIKLTPASVALKPSLSNAVHFLPYIAILAAVLLSYEFLLDAQLDEFTAPVILPVIVIAILWFERSFSHDFIERNKTAKASPTLSKAFTTAVDNSAIQIGALLMLMACSFTVGGMIERAGGTLVIPEAFGSIYLTMAFLIVFLIFIGMVMDPFGALILVTGTIAPVAYANGIHPIHFWMTCLMAFELGYLSPPVSLNHLLTRQVVGDEEVELALKEGDSFYYRHERLLLPLMVMGTTLVIVAFVPLYYMSL